MYTICVCASGGGGNFEALYKVKHEAGYEIASLITDRECGAVAVAEELGVECSVIQKTSSEEDFWRRFSLAVPEGVNLIVLAGFMPILPQQICRQWAGKIINTHPSLLPKYGGKGMYGVKVQEAVIANGEPYAGCTVHFVTEKIDAGEIILQKRIKVIQGESAWDLGGRVFREEVKLLPEAIKLLISKGTKCD